MTPQTPGGSACPPSPPAGPPDLCHSCSREPARPGQRTGKRCHATYMRGWRHRRKQLRLDLLDLVDQIRAQLGAPR